MKSLEIPVRNLGDAPEGQSVLVVADTTALAAVITTFLSDGTVAIVGDGSLYKLKANATTGGIQPTTGPGRWYLLTSLSSGVDVKSFGAVGDGVANDTAAIQAAIDSGARSIRLSAGTYLVDTLTLSGAPSRNGFKLIGDGVGSTILVSRTTDTPILEVTAGLFENSVVGDFSVKAHANGSTTGAIYCSGFRRSTFKNISALDNAGKGFRELFNISATPLLCYGNTFEGILFDGLAGWAYGFNFTNGGNVNSGSNGGAIRDCYFIDCANLSVAINGCQSQNYEISNVLFENCAGATYIIPGSTWKISTCWFELGAANIDYASSGGQTPNSTTVISNTFATAGNVDFHSSALGNVWMNNTEYGTQTFINSVGESNIKVSLPERHPTNPTFGALSAGGTIATFIATETKPYDPFSNTFTFLLTCTYTPAAATGGSEQIPLVLPANTAVVSASVGADDQNNGNPLPLFYDAANNKLWAWCDTTHPRSLHIFVTLRFTN